MVRGPHIEQFLETAMSSKKKNPSSTNTNPQALKIGSRVRCTDDRVEGRIVWANGVSVKIRWDDGEQVTWRRDSLGDRPIEFLTESGDADQPEAPGEPAQDQITTTEPITADSASPTPDLANTEAAQPTAEPTQTQANTENSVEPTPVSVKPKRQRKAPAEPKEKKLSALDAAAKILGETAQPMTCQEMIEQMAAKGYWSSPKGRTPEATLYSAVLREIAAKGEMARFVKTERGKFARNGAA